jgi:hypothetical protein
MMNRSRQGNRRFATKNTKSTKKKSTMQITNRRNQNKQRVFSIPLLSLLTPVQKHCSVCSVASVANLPCLVKFSEGGYFTAVRWAASSAMPCEGAVTDFGKHSDSGDQAR